MPSFSVAQRFSSKLRTTQPLSLLIGSLWFAAAAACLAGFMGLLYWPLSTLLVLPVTALLLCLNINFPGTKSASKTEWAIVVVMVFSWLLHALQVFTPETGFDAVWYHLPVARENAAAHSFVFQPELYQSVNPLFSDSLFLLGYLGFGPLGTKYVAYLLGLSLAVLVYHLAREFLDRPVALATTALISSFQVIVWQSASFYIDVAVGLWLCAAVWFGLQWLRSATRWYLVAAGMAVGAALASKLFLIVLLPAVVLGALVTRRRQYTVAGMQVSLVAVAVAMPMYVFTWYHLGHPFYSLLHHSQTIAGIGEGNNLATHVWQRFLQFPQFFWQVGITRDYTTPLLLGFAPSVVHAVWQKKLHPLHLLLLFAACALLLVWWFIPPLSTRYGLAGFVLATIFTISQVQRNAGRFQKQLPLALLVLTLVSLAPRYYVALKSLRYLAGFESKRQYLERSLDGNIDTVLKTWHSDVFQQSKR